jgi:hypothetical protein
MKIFINDLRILCEKILTKAEKSGIKELEIDFDYYWDVSSEDKCNLETKDPDVIVGSLVDDLNGLKNILKNENPPTIIDFERLGSLIKAAGDSISKSESIY